MYIHKNLKYLRDLKGMTQDQVAEMFGKQKGAVSAYEKGKSIPPGDILVKLAQYFEVSIDDFVLRDIEKEGTSEAPLPQDPAEMDAVLLSTIKRLERHVMYMEQKIRERDPELARELGLE